MEARTRLFAFAKGGSRTIRFRLITLVLLVLLPLLALFAWVAADLARARMRLIEIERQDAAERISAETDRQMARTIGALVGLATSDDVRRGSEQFKEQATAIAARVGLANLRTLNRAGGTLITMGQTAGGGASVFDAVMAQRIFRGEVAVSSVRGDGLSHATVSIAVPVLDGSNVVSGLAADVPAATINRAFIDAGLGDGWVAAVVDRDGRFVARSLDPDRRIGLMARPELGVAAKGEANFGTFENVTLEGTPMLNSYRRSRLTDWTSVVAIPTAIVHAPLRRNTLLVLLIGSAALLLTIGAAIRYASRISEPVRNLGLIATGLAKGQPGPATRYALAELDEVRKAIEDATAESAHLAALVTSSGDAIMSMQLDGVVRTWNPAAERLFGYKAAEIVGRPKALLVPPDRMEEFLVQQAQVAAGESVRNETVRRHRDGTPIAVSVNAAPIRRPDGTIIATSSILHDITERIADEEHRRFLMREIAHRSKNQLAIIQAIANQTARASGSINDFLSRFRGRLQGLAASHDLLLNQNWHGAPLDGLVRSQIAVFTEPTSRAVNVAGPPVMLTASATEAIGLAIHELATNSAKYGALSVPTGTVSVAWKAVPAAAGQAEDWELTWEENGGPVVKEPMSSGFGSQVIKRMAPMSVQGKAELEFRESGIYWRLVFPSSALRPERRQAPGEARSGSDVGPPGTARPSGVPSPSSQPA